MVTIEIPDTDTEFDELPLEEVRAEGNGYVLKRDGWSLYIDNPGFEPVAGQIARYYGEGIGRPVRGVMVDGKVCRYQSKEELRVEEAARSAKWKAEEAENAKLVEAHGRSEKAMRESDAPWPKTLDELSAYIKSQVDGPHDYGTCVYAMSLAAVAAFNYVAHALGTTGFQSSCADLDVIRRTRGINGPFILLKAEDALYPQNNLRVELNEALGKWQPWLREQAQRRLQEKGEAHPKVRAHWKLLAK